MGSRDPKGGKEGWTCGTRVVKVGRERGVMVGLSPVGLLTGLRGATGLLEEGAGLGLGVG